MKNIMRIVAGSRMYETQNTDSDEDYIEVNIPDFKELFSISKAVKTKQTLENNTDTSTYDLRSYLNALKKGGLQHIEGLFCLNKKIIKDSSYFQLLRKYKYTLLSKASIKRNILGFAKHRFIKITESMNPLTRLYLFCVEHSLSYEENIETLISKGKIPSEHIITINKNNISYNHTLVDLYNILQTDSVIIKDISKYDYKSAYHIIRCLYTIEKLLKQGSIFPYENEMKTKLLQIKNGQYDFISFFIDYERFLCEVESLDSAYFYDTNVDDLYDLIYLKIIKYTLMGVPDSIGAFMLDKHMKRYIKEVMLIEWIYWKTKTIF